MPFICLQDTVYGSLGERLTSQVLGLRGLYQHLTHVKDYLHQVTDGTLPVNHTIVYQLQVTIYLWFFLFF